MEKLRLIQCGVGGFGHGWVKDISSQSPDFDLVAIVDLSEKTLKESGELVGLPPEKRFTTLEAALEKVEADAVLTITPPAVHVKHARVAFGHGLHLMTEKPIAENLADGQEMVELARKAGKQLLVSQQYRYEAPAKKFRSLINEGVIGEIGHGHLDFYIPGDFTGSFRETMEFPLLLDMTIHHADLIRAWTGRNVTKVFAKSFRPTWSWYKHDPGLKMLLELEGGVTISYSGDWSAKGFTTAWPGNWRLQGSEGSLHFENEKIRVVRSDRWFENQTIEDVVVPVTEVKSQHETLHRFAEAIRTGVPGETSGEDNINSLAIVVAAMKSIRENREVSLSEILPGA